MSGSLSYYNGVMSPFWGVTISRGAMRWTGGDLWGNGSKDGVLYPPSQHGTQSPTAHFVWLSPFVCHSGDSADLLRRRNRHGRCR